MRTVHIKKQDQPLRCPGRTTAGLKHSGLSAKDDCHFFGIISTAFFAISARIASELPMNGSTARRAFGPPIWPRLRIALFFTMCDLSLSAEMIRG